MSVERDPLWLTVYAIGTVRSERGPRRWREWTAALTGTINQVLAARRRPYSLEFVLA